MSFSAQQLSPSHDCQTLTEHTEQWFSRIRRVAKLFMVEPDPAEYDLDFWLRFFDETHVDAVNACAGGITAFYPTEIPFHQRSRWLGDRDAYGELVTAARERGARVIARIDPHATHAAAKEVHPEWIALDHTGAMKPHPASPGRWLTCVHGAYSTDFMYRVIEEICQRYQPDAFHVNRWLGVGVCHCDFCRQTFAAFSGAELPAVARGSDPGNPLWQDYDRWLATQQLAIWDRTDALVRQYNPEGRYLPNTHGARGFPPAELHQRLPLINIDYQARGVAEPIWNMGFTARQVRGSIGKVAIVAGISPTFEGNGLRWKDSVRDIPELRMWYLGAIANGLRIAWGKFSATLYDQRWLQPIREIFSWHHRHDRYLRDDQSNADVLVLWSKSASRRRGDAVDTEKQMACKGCYLALLEARITCDLLDTEQLSLAALEGYRAVVLPDVGRLSDAQCDILRRYCATGGSLVATAESSLFDQDGSMRDNFGLADVFGVDLVSPRHGPVKNAYLNIVQPANESLAPLLAGIEEAGRTIFGTHGIEVTPREPVVDPLLTLVPSYPDLPMEDVFPNPKVTDICQLFAHDSEAGRVVYFPWDLAATFWNIVSGDHGKLLANAVRWALRGEQQVSVSGPGLVEVTSWMQEQSLTVHLVNHSHPFADRGTLHELIPVGEQQVRIRVPAGRTVTAVKLLVAEQDAAWTEADGCIMVVVPSVLDHEVIAIDTACG